MNAVIEELKSIAGEDRVLTQNEELIPYGFDATATFKQTPGCVVFPANAEETAAVVACAARRRIPVVTRGAGTGLSGGSVPSAGCVVLCLVRMNRILEVDARNLTLSAESGVVTRDVAAAAAEAGLFYPPDPGSLDISTIGGNVAENSGGLRGLKYGVTRNYVMGLDVVLPDGTFCRFGNKCVKDVAGYSMKDLFVGSEGTLGVITRVLLRLLPGPRARRTLLAGFPTMDAAAAAVSAIIEAKMIPCTLEFLDRVTIGCVEDHARIGLPRDVEAVLLMETDGHPAVVAEEAGRMEKIARDNAAVSVETAADEEEAARLATARRAAFSSLARLRPTTILEDVTVPRSELVVMVRKIQEVGRRHRLTIGTFGHMGDGNLHPTILADERNKEEMERVHRAMNEIFEYAIELGGTITGEHGIGLAKRPFMKKQFSEAEFGLMRAFKRAVDPENLLNPGKIFGVGDGDR